MLVIKFRGSFGRFNIIVLSLIFEVTCFLDHSVPTARVHDLTNFLLLWFFSIPCRDMLAILIKSGLDTFELPLEIFFICEIIISDSDLILSNAMVLPVVGFLMVL